MRLATTTALAFLFFQTGQGPAQQQRQTLPGGIEGLVLQATNGEPIAKAQVTLTRVVPPPAVPPTAANPPVPIVPKLVKSAITDQNGRFTFRGVSPGNYKIFAWEGLETNAYFDPEVLRQYEQQGKL